VQVITESTLPATQKLLQTLPGYQSEPSVDESGHMLSGASEKIWISDPILGRVWEEIEGKVSLPHLLLSPLRHTLRMIVRADASAHVWQESKRSEVTYVHCAPAERKGLVGSLEEGHVALSSHVLSSFATRMEGASRCSEANILR